MRYPYGYGSGTYTMSALRDRYEPKMHPEFARRLFAAIEAAGGLVGIGGGWRSTETQAANYARAPGTFAPPGSSFHESQLFASGIHGYQAVDTVGVNGRHQEAWDWLKNNGHKYGLVTFWNVNSEPWHVQCADIPLSVSKWKRAGSPDPAASFALPGQQEVEMQYLVVPDRVYDSRVDGEAFAAGETRAIPVGLAHVVQVHITVLGVENGFVSISGSDVQSDTSLVNIDASTPGKTQVRHDTATIAVPDGKVRVTASTGCHVIVDVYGRGA